MKLIFGVLLILLLLYAIFAAINGIGEKNENPEALSQIETKVNEENNIERRNKQAQGDLEDNKKVNITEYSEEIHTTEEQLKNHQFYVDEIKEENQKLEVKTDINYRKATYKQGDTNDNVTNQAEEMTKNKETGKGYGENQKDKVHTYVKNYDKGIEVHKSKEKSKGDYQLSYWDNQNIETKTDVNNAGYSNKQGNTDESIKADEKTKHILSSTGKGNNDNQYIEVKTYANNKDDENKIGYGSEIKLEEIVKEKEEDKSYRDDKDTGNDEGNKQVDDGKEEEKSEGDKKGKEFEILKYDEDNDIPGKSDQKAAEDSFFYRLIDTPETYEMYREFFS